jgi:hypothetical protein
MKHEVPLYEGDSIIRHGPSTPPETRSGKEQVDSTADLLRRTKTPDALELIEIEARARALRAATIADLLGRFWTWLGMRLERAHRRRVEEYLARAQNLAELERRLRKLERQGHVMHI